MNSLSEKTNWKAVITFYVLACLWSWPFFWWRDIHPESFKSWDVPLFVKTWSYMCGPAISAIICFFLFRDHKRRITFSGNSLMYGLVFYTVMILSLATWNLDLKYIYYIAPLGFIAIAGEEFGWRGFLQDALNIKSDFIKAIVIGIMWEVWHFTNRTANKPIDQAVKMVLIWVVITTVLSFIMIHLTKRTQSLLVAITFHAGINSAAEFPNGWQAILSCVPIWIFLLWRWPSEKQPSDLTA